MNSIKAHFDTFWSRRYLLMELVKKGIKLKYRRSYLGILWSLIEPILQTVVLTIVFGTLLGRGGRDFPMYVLSGRLLYGFFSSSTKACSKSIQAHSGLIKKVYVPKYLYPLSGVLYNYVIFLISLLVMLPLGIYCKISPSWTWIGVVIPLLILVLLTFGVGMILATITVFFRDMEYMWDVALMVIMYTCAIFYMPEKLLETKFAFLLTLNPVFCIIQNFRSCLFHETYNWGYTLYALIFALVATLIGTYAFYKKQDDFILYL